MEKKENIDKRINFIHYINFPINMGYAIQNVWITALMINFNTHDGVDSFIWIIPNILTILIRPYFIRFIHKNRCLIQVQYSLTTLFLILGGFGCVLVAASVIPKNNVIRIIICTIGWTLMGAGFQLCQFVSQKLKQRFKKQYKDIQIQDQIPQKLSFYGQLCGYIVSFFICIMNQNKNFKNFRYNSAYAYLTVSILIFLNVMVFFDKKSIQIISKINVQKQEIVNILQQPGFYFSGFYQLKAADINDKFYIFIRFLSLWIVDTILIYCSMWIIYGFQQIGQKQSISYNKGMQYGSLLLLLYTYISEFKIKKVSQFFYFFLLIMIAMICLVSFCLNSYFIGPVILIITAGISSSVFTQHIEPKWEQQNFVFEGTKQIIERMQKTFILCPMPFTSMILLGRDDVNDSIICVTFMVGIGVLLFIIKKINFSGIRKKTGKVSKVE